MDSSGFISGHPEEAVTKNLAIRVLELSPPRRLYFDYFTLVIDDGLIGDADCSGTHNILDVTYIIDYLYKNGSSPASATGCDCDCSSDCNILDVTYIVNYLYKNGPEPCSP
jgi:hypothetical protein